MPRNKTVKPSTKFSRNERRRHNPINYRVKDSVKKLEGLFRISTKGNSSSTPSSKKMVFPIVDAISMSSTVSPNLELYSCNSIFDPYQETGGHQPLGFDQWATFFNRYRVNECHVSARFLSASNMYVGIVLHNSSTALTGLTILEMMEKFGAKFRMITANQKPTTISLKIDIAKQLGFSKAQTLINTDFDGLFSGNPGIQTYFSLVSQNIDGLTQASVYGTLKIKYKTLLWDSLLLPSS